MVFFDVGLVVPAGVCFAHSGAPPLGACAPGGGESGKQRWCILGDLACGVVGVAVLLNWINMLIVQPNICNTNMLSHQCGTSEFSLSTANATTSSLFLLIHVRNTPQVAMISYSRRVELCSDITCNDPRPR